MNAVIIALVGFHALWTLMSSLNTPALAVTKFIGLLAYLQLVLAPWLFYEYFQDSPLANLWDLNMQVAAKQYFDYCFPAYLALIFGMARGARKSRTTSQTLGIKDLNSTSKRLLLVGVIANVLLALTPVPQGVAFAFKLVADLVYGALIALHIMYIRTGSHSRWLSGLLSPFSIIIFFLLIRQASSGGMFGEMIFLLLSFVIITFQVTKPSKSSLIIFSLSGVLFVGAIQLTKNNYRQLVWRGSGKASIGQLYSSFVESVQDFRDIMNQEALWFSNLTRINQGYLVSHVISKCESDNIMLNGQKSLESMAASVIPRIFWPNKPMAGGRENIERYTNKTLVGSTSMNISYFGDFYIDFGPKGGIFALFVFGHLLARAIRWIINLSTTRPVFFIALPLILSGIVQIETDLLMIVNHFMKSIVLFFVMDWWLTRIRAHQPRNTSERLIPS